MEFDNTPIATDTANNLPGGLSKTPPPPGKDTPIISNTAKEFSAGYDDAGSNVVTMHSAHMSPWKPR